MVLQSRFAFRQQDARCPAVSGWLCVCVLACLSASAAEPVGSLQETLAKGVLPGTVVTLRSDEGPMVSDLTAENLRGQPGKPVVICGVEEVLGGLSEEQVTGLRELLERRGGS